MNAYKIFTTKSYYVRDKGTDANWIYISWKDNDKIYTYEYISSNWPPDMLILDEDIYRYWEDLEASLGSENMEGKYDLSEEAKKDYENWCANPRRSDDDGSAIKFL